MWVRFPPGAPLRALRRTAVARGHAGHAARAASLVFCREAGHPVLHAVPLAHLHPVTVMDVARQRSEPCMLLRTIAPNMEQAKSFLRLIAWAHAVMPVAVVVALARAHLRRRRDVRRQHVQRLAAEIVEVAQSIAHDLELLPRKTDAAAVARRCGDCRQR